LYIDKKAQPKILPKIGLVSARAPLSENYYKGYYTSSFQLFSNNGNNTSLPVINLNKLTIMSPSRTVEHTGFDHKTTNYSKFIHNLKNKNSLKLMHLIKLQTLFLILRFLMKNRIKNRY
jgi:hypothetical protein